jgi:hypothetical protein
LIVERVDAQPIIQVLHPTAEIADLVVIIEAFDTHSVDPLEPTGSACLGDQLLGWPDRPVECSNEPLVVVVSQSNRPMCLHELRGFRYRSIQEKLRYGDARQPGGLGQQVVIVG